MRKYLYPALAILVLAVAGCTSNPSADKPTPPSEPTATPIQLTPEARPVPARIPFGNAILDFDVRFPRIVRAEDDSIEITVRVVNASSTPVTLVTPWRHVILTIFDGQGSIVWPPSFNGFVQANLPPGSEFTLNPGEFKDWIVTWDLQNQNGERVWAGDYEIKLTANQNDPQWGAINDVAPGYPLLIVG